MGHGPRFRMPLKRRLKGKTNYRNRLNLIKSGKVRAVVRRSNRYMMIQLVRYRPEGDEVVLTFTSDKLKSYGWEGSGNNVPASYLAGFIAGKKAVKMGIDEAVLDIGMNMPEYSGKFFAALKGMIDAGVDIPHNPSVLPDEDRLTGKHINEDVVKMFESVKKDLEEL